MINILFIGDINGKPGRKTVKALLPGLIKEKKVDFVIANGENMAGGFGLTRKTFDEIMPSGTDVITTGNHVWDKKELLTFIDSEKELLRPANFPPSNPGRGYDIYETKNKDKKIAVINLQGRIFMPPVDCPFRAAETILEEIKGKADIIIVDFHAEATSEKKAMGFFLDGKVTAVIGTHTHIATADNQIFEKGTAYITDAGMTGPHDSVIGVKKEIIVNKFLNSLPEHFETAKKGARLNGVLISASVPGGKATKIERLDIPYET